MKKFLLLLIVANLFFSPSHAQSVSFSSDGLPPDNSAMLDLRNSNKGLLIPRVVLMGTNDATTIPSPAISLLVYNTATTVGATAVIPGYYYWNGTTWNRLSTGSWLLTGNTGTDTSVNFLGTTDNKSLQFKVNNIRSGYIGVPANDGNIFWGYQSGLGNTGFSNVGLGIKALFSNSTVSNLIAIGDSALFQNTTGTGNTAVGSKALYSNTTGGVNTAFGFGALYSNTSGTWNTANGSYALYSNTTGNDNTAYGLSALLRNTTGNSNTAIGDDALWYNTTGNENTANGHFALSSNTIGSNNTAIGYGANVSSEALTNATALGSGAIVNASNKVRIGNADVSVIEGQVAYSFPSDGRFKYDIQNNVPGLDFIQKLKPVTYYFDEEKLAEYTKTGIINNSIIKLASYCEKQLHTGFVAQDVEKIARELGYSFDGVHAPANDKDHYSLAYSQFIMPLVKSVQEQQAIIEVQNKKINGQAEQIKMMNEKIEALGKAVEVLANR